MSAQRYERVAGHDDETTTTSPHRPSVPNSPPPSFRSRASSFAHHNTLESERLVSDADRTLADTFDGPSDDDSSDDGRSRPHTHRPDERQRALSARPHDNSTSSPEHASNTAPTTTTPPAQPRRTTQLSSFFTPRSSATTRSNQAVNDGVFANLSAKPTRGEEADEKPPTYEQAAADATPPYWETTILSPGASSDDVYIDGLPVGSLFSFLWNGMISASFQLVGFLLTYLLHTTHAAKHGSKAGLGITLIQYGFGMRSAAAAGSSPGSGDFVRPPADPNNHDFDPNAVVVGAAAAAQAAAEGGVRAMQASDWFAYALMIAGWFILVRALGEYFKARRHEQLVLQSPGRGLNVAVVAEGERPETAV